MKQQIQRFETERTAHFRAEDLSEMEKRTISDIEKFGCQVIHVQLNGVGPDFYYTIGLYDTCRKPEIITVGLSPETAIFC